ncbi:MAG: hypothetical protein EHM45_22475, partial [Desulfobacteraceae bacterium]
MKKSIRLLAVAIGMLVLAWAGAAWADYNVTVGSATSANGSWTGNIWTPSGTGATVSVSDIQTRLVSGDVTINTTGGGSESGDIAIETGLSWSANTLFLNAAGDIRINAVLTANDSSALNLNSGTNAIECGFKPGEAQGFKGRVDFPGRAGMGFLVINAENY